MRAALDDVASDDGTGECIPVVDRPLVPPGGRADHDRGICDTPADHHVCASLQRGSDTPPAHVRIGRDRIASQRCTRVQMAELWPQVVDAIHQVIAVDVGHANFEPQHGCDLAHFVGAARRVEAAGVRDDLDAPLDACRKHLFHLA